MKEFDNMLSFVGELAKITVAAHAEMEKSLERVAVKIEKTAKNKIGVYQSAVGGFAAWAQLTEGTQADRARKGYSPDAPLLRTGKLRDSISHKVKGLEAEIGSNSEIAVWQEMGTKNIPPRSFLGASAEENREYIYKEIGSSVVTGLLGGKTNKAVLGQ